MKISNLHGLTFSFHENSAVECIDVAPIRISMLAASPFARSGANVYLRKTNSPGSFIALTGANSNCQFAIGKDSFHTKGTWQGIEFECTLQLSAFSNSWQWLITTKNNTLNQELLDIVYVQDVGMKPSTDGLVNEYYVSQYLERLILHDETYGEVVCCRQNTRETVGNPWILMACRNGAASASTDGMQFLGKNFRASSVPEALLNSTLGGEYSGELSIVAIQEKPFSLEAGQSHNSSFVASFQLNHPDATSDNDLKLIPGILKEFNSYNTDNLNLAYQSIKKNLFNEAPFFQSENLNQEELTDFFGTDRRHVEIQDGKLLSFFYGQNKHVMLREKELLADRPHGHIIQAKAGLKADENIVSTTCYATGVFNSHLTQGNTNFNIFLSVNTSQFNQSPESGQRIFVEIDGQYHLLGVPSAFEMGLNHCRWIYKSGKHCFEVRSWTSKTSDRVNLSFKIVNGEPSKLLITNNFDKLNKWSIAPGNLPNEFIALPASGTMISEKFPNAQFRILINGNPDFEAGGEEFINWQGSKTDNSFFVLKIGETNNFSLSFVGEVVESSNEKVFLDNDVRFENDCREANQLMNELCLNLSLQNEDSDLQAIAEIIPWFGNNALAHFLTPHGLEQFGGAAWGTRDVSQGPFDLLLCLQKYDDARQVLLTIFSNQNPSGDWPQWWMFDSYFNIRAGDCHGDVYYWCIISLASYIRTTGDITILNEVLPYYHEKGLAMAEKTPLSEHMSRLIAMITDSFIPNTAFVPFAGGDWNDSLQPVSHELASRMISSWTVEMNYQAFNEYKNVFELTGQSHKAAELNLICERIKSDFNRYLVRDGVVAGYGLVEKDGNISVLLHPDDKTTGIQYSILPMDRGVISGIFTAEQAEKHQAIIEKHLKGPDGARLMDRPLKYKGGLQTLFQRAESSTFFGREIGIMYVHEHIRYAESLAVTGKADAFVKALRQANPVAYREIVECGDIRQSNCYYSSSDVAFKSRYEADERYNEVLKGDITLRGGWRVYSSGPGIYITLIVSRLLGLRVKTDEIVIDPVIPSSMNGLAAALNFIGHEITFTYRVKENSYSPKSIKINGASVPFMYEENQYRNGGAVFKKDDFLSHLKETGNSIEIEL